MYLIDEGFSDHGAKDGDHKILYLVLIKALHGTTEVALLWHNLLSNTLIKCIFELDPCDLCPANASEKDKQCSIMCDTVDDDVHMLKSEFGQMKVARGSCHEFIGQVITHDKNGIFDLGMSSYLKEAVEEFGYLMETTVMPSRSDLFEVECDSPLADEKNKIFHFLARKLLCCSCRGGNIFRWPFLSLLKELKLSTKEIAANSNSHCIARSR